MASVTGMTAVGPLLTRMTSLELRVVHDGDGDRNGDGNGVAIAHGIAEGVLEIKFVVVFGTHAAVDGEAVSDGVGIGYGDGEDYGGVFADNEGGADGVASVASIAEDNPEGEPFAALGEDSIAQLMVMVMVVVMVLSMVSWRRMAGPPLMANFENTAC